MKKNPVIIINNEKVFKDGDNHYCDNLDMKVLPEGLNANHEVEFIVRSSKVKGSQPLNLRSIKVASNIFKFIYFIINTFKKKKYKLSFNNNNTIYIYCIYSSFFV